MAKLARYTQTAYDKWHAEHSPHNYVAGSSTGWREAQCSAPFCQNFPVWMEDIKRSDGLICRRVWCAAHAKGRQ